MRHLGGHQQEPDAWRTLAQWIGLWSLTKAAMFGVIEKESGEWIGRIGPWHPLHWPTLEVGWGLRKAYWGQGYAFEAASACIDYAFDELGWDEVTHLIEDANTPSQTLATRLGSAARRIRSPSQVNSAMFGCASGGSQKRSGWQENDSCTSKPAPRTSAVLDHVFNSHGRSVPKSHENQQGLGREAAL
jgi:hypothetical protein